MPKQSRTVVRLQHRWTDHLEVLGKEAGNWRNFKKYQTLKRAQHALRDLVRLNKHKALEYRINPDDLKRELAT